jgi:hypothetical protein
MANANSAKESSEKDNLKTDEHAALTFTEVPSTQEVDTNHENDHNCDVDRQVVGLISDDQLLLMGNHPRETHVVIPVCDQNRGSSDFTGNTDGSGL